MIGMHLGRLGRIGPLTKYLAEAQQIEDLFASGEQGGWYDPSDMPTLFQDAAGAVPVTAVEQPVGRVLDKSGRGNHATQATTTKRPIYSRRVNLLMTTETLAVWGLTGIGGASPPVITPGQADHVGGNTGVRVVLRLNGATATSAQSRAAFNFPVTSGTAYTTRFWIKSNTGSNSTLRFRDDLSHIVSGYVTATPDWQFVTHTGTVSGVVGLSTTSPLWLRGGDFTSDFADVTIAHMSTTLATDAHLPYQRVTAADYDADPAKFPAYLRFDGVDDALQTGNIDFTGTDKMTVWAGVWAPPDDGRNSAIVCIPDTGIPRYWLGHPFSGFTYSSAAGATAERSISAPFLAGNAIITASLDLAGVQKVAINGGAPLNNAAGTGGGNFRNAPIRIGADLESNRFYFNGRLYSLIVRGARSSLSQIEATELYIKQKMRLP